MKQKIQQVGYFEKVKLLLVPLKHHVMKKGLWRYSSIHFLISSLDGGKWSASRFAHFTPPKCSPLPTESRLGWPHSRLDAEANIKISCS
jgi:hypothetical protein